MVDHRRGLHIENLVDHHGLDVPRPRRPLRHEGGDLPFQRLGVVLVRLDEVEDELLVLHPREEPVLDQASQSHQG
jgi:hypothetical protein